MPIPNSCLRFMVSRVKMICSRFIAEWLENKRQSFVCFRLGNVHQNLVRTEKQINVEIWVQLRPFVVLHVISLGPGVDLNLSYESSIQSIVVTLCDFSLKASIHDGPWLQMAFYPVLIFISLRRNPPQVRVRREQNVCSEISAKVWVT